MSNSLPIVAWAPSGTSASGAAEARSSADGGAGSPMGLFRTSAIANPPRAAQIPADIRRAQDGDLEAFERMYREHVGRIHALMRRLAADAVDADELCQEVFVRVWERLGSYRGESAFGTWLHRLAVNVALGGRRSDGRRLARVLPMAEPDSTASDPSARSHDAALDLARALEVLPARARQVFVLHDVEGWPHEEIAAAMDTTVGTSKAQLHRARSLLRSALS
jgi:RNA polymerase sigma-70 factor, ECF subfamily